MCFCLGKNALSRFGILCACQNDCVAASGALRFSCAAPAAHFFVKENIAHEWQKQQIPEQYVP